MPLKPTEPYTSWTHRLARWCVRPLVGTSIEPNQLTTGRFLTGLLACVAFSWGGTDGNVVGGILWLISAFLDRADGELARLSGKTSATGHYYDYVTDVAVNSLFFFAIGVGARTSFLGWMAMPMGLTAALAVAFASIVCERYEQDQGDGAKAYTGVAGFDFDDVLYLFAPIAWLNWLLPILIGASVGAPAFALWTWWRFRAQLANEPGR
jgi:phosphatidylglycerophosphate synthase